eukprot:5556943-Amphidinium_carterae.1
MSKTDGDDLGCSEVVGTSRLRGNVELLSPANKTSAQLPTKRKSTNQMGGFSTSLGIPVRNATAESTGRGPVVCVTGHSG